MRNLPIILEKPELNGVMENFFKEDDDCGNVVTFGMRII